MPPVAPVVRRTTAALFALAMAASALPGLVETAGAQTAPGRLQGMGISPPGTPQQTIANELPRMRAAGINAATIDVWWDVDSDTKSEITPGSITISDADLRLAIRRAKQAGVKVLLEPKIWCPRCEPSTWRGYIEPDDPAAFFDDYRAMIDHYAEIAQAEGVDIYYLGSEMSLVQDETEEWRQLAREVRQRFKGTLTYGVNWNVLNRVHFWDTVDIVSVSAYFPLSGDARPTIDELKAAWQSSKDPAWRGRRWFDEVVALQRDTRKPLFFGEAGYLSSTYAASKPYDETQTHDPNQELQSDAYQALLETFDGQSWWMGVVWWEWTLSPGNDMSYSPRNKIAEKLLKGWYVDGWRPSAAQRSFYDPPPPPTTAAAPGDAGATAAPGNAQGAPTAATTPGASAPGATTQPNGGGSAIGTPEATSGAANGSGATGTEGTPGLPLDETAAPDESASTSRTLVLAIAAAALLLVLLPMSALVRRVRRPAADPFPASDTPPDRVEETV